MGHQLFDDSVISSNTPIKENTLKSNDYKLYRCMVINTIFTDSTDNITQKAKSPEVLYDCIILGGFKSGQVISNCRLSSDLGNNFNYYEKILKPSSKKFPDTRLNEHDGDIVLVQFVQGHSGYPMIVATDKGTNTQGKIGAVKEDGLREIKQYNGVFTEINKDGEYNFQVKGGEYDPEAIEFKIAGQAENATEEDKKPLYEKSITKDQKVTETFKSGLTQTVDGLNELIETTFKSGTSYKIDAKNELIETTFNSGLKITHDGQNDKSTITTAAGPEVEIDGSGSKITISAGGTSVEIDGNSGKVSVKGDFVDLGKSVSDFVPLFTQLLTAFNSHTHLVPQAPSGTLPSQPPTVPMASSVGSQTVKVQS